MNFDPVAYINTPRGMEFRLGLERTIELLTRLGSPQKSLRFVHVAGTNGKGSTCAFLSHVLQEAGYKTGLFTSPFIIDFYDRIRIDGENISHDSLVAITLEVKAAADAMEDYPTEFELMTAVAFLYFQQQGCDIVVCEVGLGGRLDSTNVIESPELCIITRIGFDHVAVLGDTLAAIAGEKAGIIKGGVPVLSWAQEPEALEVIEQKARELGSPFFLPDFSQVTVGNSVSREAQTFGYKNLGDLQIALLGNHQPFNAAMAIEAAWLLREKGWVISDEALRAGLANTRWAGRFEIVSQDPTFIIDGAHNVDGVKALVDSLKTIFPQKKPVFIVGVLNDKDYKRMLEIVIPHGAAFVAVEPPNRRAIPAAELAETLKSLKKAAGYSNDVLPVSHTTNYADAVSQARAIAGKEGVVCAFGSLYSVAPTKQAL